MTSISRSVLSILAALASYCLFLFMPQVLNDGDTYLHVAAGEWILQHGQVPHTDPFSYTMQGAPWVAHEWLSEVMMVLAYRFGGWSGVLVLCGGGVAIAFGLFARHLSHWLQPLPVIVVLIIGGGCAAGSLLARPHILVLPLLEIWTMGLLLARERGRVSWALLPLMTLWANMHGSFVFGLALIVPFALEAMLASGGAWRKVLRDWGIFSVLAVVAALLTPHGVKGLLFPFQLMTMHALAQVGEWQSSSFQALKPLEIALLAALYVSFSRGIRVPMMRLVILLGLLHLALHHERHTLILGIVGSLVFAESLARGLAVPAKTAQSAQAAAKTVMPMLIGWGGVAVCALITLLRFVHPAAYLDRPASPGSAFAHVPQDLASTPVLNDYTVGPFLIFKGVRPYVDSRADMYGDAFLFSYSEMMRPNRARLEKTINDFNIKWALLNPNSPAVETIDALPGWHRLFADEFAVVFVRDETF